MRSALLLLLGSIALASGFSVTTAHSMTTAHSRSPTAAMAGFGGAGGASKPAAKKAKGGKKAAASKPAAAKLSPKRQWDIFRELRDQGVEPMSVFAKLPDDDAKWVWVGEVAAAAPATAEQAANVHKRLILEHAARAYPALLPRARDLVCGIAAAGFSTPFAAAAALLLPLSFSWP